MLFSLSFKLLFIFALLLQAAPTPPDPTANASDFVNAVFQALQSKNWHVLAALLVIGLVSFTKWVVPKLHGKLGQLANSQRGGTVLVLLWGTATAIGVGLYAGAKVNLALFEHGIMLGVIASGGWNVIWDLFAPEKPKDTQSGTIASPPAK